MHPFDLYLYPSTISRVPPRPGEVHCGRICSLPVPLNSEEHIKLHSSWNIALKIIRDLPHSTHFRFLETLSPVIHMESSLSGRYFGFCIGNFKKGKNARQWILALKKIVELCRWLLRGCGRCLKVSLKTHEPEKIPLVLMGPRLSVACAQTQEQGLPLAPAAFFSLLSFRSSYFSPRRGRVMKFTSGPQLLKW